MSNIYKRTVILILIYVFITTFLLRLIQILPKYSKESTNRVDFVIKQKPNNCFYRLDQVEFTLPNCEVIRIGQRFVVEGGIESPITVDNSLISRVMRLIDKQNNQIKRLKIENYYQYQYSITSPKDWLLYFEEKMYTAIKSLSINIDQNSTSGGAWITISAIMGNSIKAPQRYQTTLAAFGLQHMIAVSGYHISFFTALLMKIIPRGVSRKVTCSLIGGILCCYWLALGSQPSVDRAIIMSLIGLITTKICFLQLKPIRSLVFTFIIVVLIDPLVLLSVSFHLSYMATLGILAFFSRRDESIIAQLETNTVQSEEKKVIGIHLLKESFMVSLIAQIYTLPILWHTFVEYPLLSLPANTFLFWLGPVLILLGVASFLISALHYFPMAEIIGSSLFSFLMAPPIFFVNSIFTIGNTLGETIILLPKISGVATICMVLLLNLLSYYMLYRRYRVRIVDYSELIKDI